MSTGQKTTRNHNGQGEIRTHEALASPPVFETGSFSHSDTCPSGRKSRGLPEVTAFFLRDLQPPAEVVAAINGKIAQEQQIQTERHRVEVARLQSDQQRLLNQTLTPEALTKQYLEVLHDMKGSSNLVIMVPTEGGLPLLDLAKLRQNLRP